MLFLMISKANRRSIRSAGHFFSMPMGSALVAYRRFDLFNPAARLPFGDPVGLGSNAALPARVALALGWAEVPA
jgi:hypothetical protein